ncbi:MAG: polysaccharide biosynthesis/export family protein [Fibrobacteraceae bacterium]|nr:polysaccharide biosynthesis/export family protein [Fibrobacteraceae bacterium]
MRFMLSCILSLSVIVLSGCFAAPGMVLNEASNESGSIDTLADFQGAKVHIQSISPRTLSALSSSTETSAAIPETLLSYKPEAYRLGPFDIVQVVVWEHPELTMPLGSYRSDNATGQLVDENGLMFYPYIGQMNVSGKTVTELRDSILQNLSKVLNNPQIDVRLLESQSQKAYVQGAVARPGVVSLSDVPVTLLEAINRCGGTTSEGDFSEIFLTRDGVTYKINLLAAYPAMAGPGDILLKNNDVIRISEARESKVYVLGEVGKQQALNLLNGKLSLSEALVSCGGLQAMSAKSEGIYVIRMGSSVRDINIYHLNARNPMALVFGDQFALRPNDIVFVDASGLARWNRVASMLLPTAQLLYYGTQVVNTTHTAKEDIMNW